jgi:hypothetical protein
MGKSIRNLSTVTRVGLDLAKRVFQVHAVDAKGEIVVARKLTRGQLIPFFAELPPCVVAMEACSSAHHWGRALIECAKDRPDVARPGCVDSGRRIRVPSIPPAGFHQRDLDEDEHCPCSRLGAKGVRLIDKVRKATGRP